MIRSARADAQAGFSLVEMVTTIAITGVLSVGLANLLQHPMNGYAAVSRRAELVALGDVALSRLTRDLRRALPNSIRVSGSGEALEFMLTAAGGRYRMDPGVNDAGGPNEEDHSDAADWLSFGGDASFNLLGRFQDRPAAYGVPFAAGARIAIYPTGSTVWSEAATNANPSTITPASTTIRLADDADEDQILLSRDHTFSRVSPNARLYVVETPVSYVCDLPAGSLWRVDGYAMRSAQPTNLTGATLVAGDAARAAERLESCRFSYSAGTASRAGLATIELVLETAGERVRMLQQVQVQNAP